MLIPFSPFAPARLPWNRRLADAANSSCASVAGPANLSRRRVLVVPDGPAPGCCLSAPGSGLSLVQGSTFTVWDEDGVQVRQVDLSSTGGTQDREEAGKPHWGPGLWLAGERCALVSPSRIQVVDPDGSLRVLTTSAESSFHATSGLTASGDGRLLVFAGAGDLHVLFHQDFLSLRLSFRRDGQHAVAGPPLHPPTLYKDGRMVLQHELGCLCCSAMGEVEWWFPGGDLAHPPVLNRNEDCGFLDSSGRTIFVDRQGTPLSEIGEPLLLAARPQGGWFGLGEEALLALDRDHQLLWRLPAASAGLPPVVDQRGWVWLVNQSMDLLQVTPRGDIHAHLGLPRRPGPLALPARGRLACALGDEVWLIG